MTADPDTVAPDVDAARRVREPRRARLPPHPGGRRRPARRHRLDARPHARRDDPARRRAGARGPEGPRRRRRRRDDRRRRARPRGLLPLPPVQRGRPREDAPARRRLVPDVRGPAARRRSPSATRSRPRSAPPRAIPAAVADVLPAIARAGDDVRPARRAAHHGLAVRRGARLPAVARHRRRRRCASNAMSTCAVVPTLICRAVAAAPRPRADRRRTPTLALRRELPLHDAGRGAAARARGRRSRSTSSPRSTTASTRRRSPRASSRRPAPTSAPRSSARSARSRARCTAARRAARSQMLDEIGTADRAEPWLRAAVERGDRLMGFGHRVYKTDDPRSLMLRERRRPARRRQDGARPAHRGDRGRGARRAEARAGGSTRTSSSTPAS